jgi:hypothetical protein
MNLCVPRPLEVNGKGIRGVEGAADNEAYTVHTINIISQRQYFVARCLSSYVGNVFDLHSTCVCFPSTPQASDVGETHSLVPGTVHRLSDETSAELPVVTHWLILSKQCINRVEISTFT